MDEKEFRAAAEATLAHIEHALEDAGCEFDFEVQPGGVLQLEFDDGSQIIINAHAAAREIWVAAKSGGFHFAPQADGKWRSARTGEELPVVLARAIAAQGGGNVSF